jgi:hypothetical protein
MTEPRPTTPAPDHRISTSDGTRYYGEEAYRERLTCELQVEAVGAAGFADSWILFERFADGAWKTEYERLNRTARGSAGRTATWCW